MLRVYCRFSSVVATCMTCAPTHVDLPPWQLNIPDTHIHYLPLLYPQVSLSSRAWNVGGRYIVLTTLPYVHLRTCCDADDPCFLHHSMLVNILNRVYACVVPFRNMLVDVFG